MRASAKSRAAHALLWMMERQEAAALTAAKTVRALGRAPRVELYFAFDDPYSAVALAPLREICARHGAQLKLFPLAEHGIENDPDAQLRRHYALQDTARLLARRGATLARAVPVAPQSTRFLASWTAGLKENADAFAEAALEALWCKETRSDVGPDTFAPLYERISGAPPPRHTSAHDARLTANHARLRFKGHWESPAALVAGAWFFAHERLEQIEERLEQLQS